MPLGQLLGLAFEVFHGLADGLDFLGLFIRDGDLEFLFEFHDELHGVERVGAKILDEVGFCDDFRFVNSQFVNNDFFNAFGYCCHFL